jgi:glyoxylase-like metal-dependent hydrolase (beta-lactamase superfamily II)
MNPPDDFDPPIGISMQVVENLRRIVAPNPSPMTYRGTNTYLVGDRELAVIDPGPSSAAHLEAILDSIGPDQRVSHIIVTHTHLDHSPLARPLAEKTGAPIYAFGGASAGRSAIMQQLAEAGDMGGGEGIDSDFQPDILVQDGEVIFGADWQLEVIHTPGHLGNHICLGLGEICFTADHVMGWASSLVSPPDGDLTDFMASCEKLASRDWARFLPGHGDVILEPAARLSWLINHRKAREAQILEALQTGPSSAAALAERIYVDTPKSLLGAATRNVLAHLIDRLQAGTVEHTGKLSPSTVFELSR